jgi:hypothetical protein
MLGRRPHALTLTLALTLAVGLLASGCGSSGIETPGSTTGDQTLGPATGSAPAGTHRVSCNVRTGTDRIALVLDLPTSYRQARIEGQDCAWSTSVNDPEAGSDLGPVSADLVVTVDHVSGDHPLREEYDAEAPAAVKGDVSENDDSILHLRLSTGVATFGDTRGDRLSWWCFCDGQNTITRMVQADGVRLTWTGVKSLEALVDQSLATALRRAGSAAS